MLFLSTIVILSSFLAFVVCSLLYLLFVLGVSVLCSLHACRLVRLFFSLDFLCPFFYQRGEKEAHSLFLICNRVWSERPIWRTATNKDNE